MDYERTGGSGVPVEELVAEGVKKSRREKEGKDERESKLAKDVMIEKRCDSPPREAENGVLDRCNEGGGACWKGSPDDGEGHCRKSMSEVDSERPLP